MNTVNIADLIKRLRETTQAGIIDCKKVEENGNDFDKSVMWLREKGIAKAAKKAGATASEGLVRAVISKKNRAYIFELNCQTDFTAKNEIFTSLADKIASQLINEEKILDEKNIQNFKIESDTVESLTTAATARIGEKIILRRIHTMEVKSNESVGIYNHTNHRVSGIVKLNNHVSQEVSTNISMHLVAMNPKFLNSSKVDQEWLKNEKQILIEQTIAEGKPKEFAEKIVLGRVNKLLAENCLVDQPFVREPSIKVSDYAKRSNAEIVDMARYEVGEGIVKEEVNFAKEVEEQMKNSR